VRAPGDPKAPGARTYKGVASPSTESVSASSPEAARGNWRALDRREGRWYGSALVNGDRDSAPDPSAPDEALVRAIANGDTQALAALYDRHAPLMFGLARRIVGGKPEAEDIVHDVFVEAWRRAADYDESRGSVKAWLLLRTRSRAIDFRKSAGVSRTVPTGDGAWLASLIDPRGDDSEAPDRARVRRVLLALNVEQREVLLLGYFEGLSSSEIAAQLSIPIGTVKSRVAAALSALRHALTDQRGVA
jgi:RNA polymerase sigma-70 factor (ECF subfamily)